MKTVMMLYVAISLFVGVSYVMNVVKLSKCDFKEPYRAEVIHAVGIIPFVGMFTGWMDVGK